MLDFTPEWQDTRRLSETECQFGRLSFFKSAANRGSLRKLFSRGSPLSPSDWDHVGNKLGPATRTLRRTGSGKHKPWRSRIHYLRVISQSTPSMRRPSVFPTKRVLMRAAYSALASL